MNISLACVTQKANLVLNPSVLAWKRQSAGAEFTTLSNSGLPPPFGKLFIKRVAGGGAPGHALLISTLERPVRCTPIFFGHKHDGAWHYYVYNLLSEVTGLDRIFTSSQYRQDQFITRGFVSAILRNACTVFEEINRRGFFYPDFCYKNLMGNPQEKTVLIIDMDSCYPLSVSQLPGSVKVDPTWWRLYLRTGAKSISGLNPTMVLGMTVVLYEALACFKCVPGVTNLATTILLGRPNDQDRLFDILDRSDQDAFRAVYHTLGNRAQVILESFGLWRQFMTNLQSGRSPDWQQVRAFTQIMLAATGNGRDG